ncbi:MAG: helix-turn-helix transcriptional regulator [Roseburia sp.]|nr:helix-turn-helix transcriptional regulator [Roseburia sp.]
MDNQKLGIFITELRKEKGLTQAQLAQKLNVTDKAVSKWKRVLAFLISNFLNH